MKPSALRNQLSDMLSVFYDNEKEILIKLSASPNKYQIDEIVFSSDWIRFSLENIRDADEENENVVMFDTAFEWYRELRSRL